MERCFGFGKFIRQGLEAQGLTGVIVCSGGLSHFPGTPRYKDRDLVQNLTLNLRKFWVRKHRHLSHDEKALDDTGNIELRLGCCLGALEARKPDVVGFSPLSLVARLHGRLPRRDGYKPHYPPIHPEKVLLSEILHTLTNDESERKRYLADHKNLSTH